MMPALGFGKAICGCVAYSIFLGKDILTKASCYNSIDMMIYWLKKPTLERASGCSFPKQTCLSVVSFKMGPSGTIAFAYQN